MSSIESAPATIPAISVGTFTAGFAEAGPDTVTVSATSRCKPHRSASLNTGANPAHDTKLGSSNTAETL